MVSHNQELAILRKFNDMLARHGIRLCYGSTMLVGRLSRDTSIALASGLSVPVSTDVRILVHVRYSLYRYLSL